MALSILSSKFPVLFCLFYSVFYSIMKTVKDKNRRTVCGDYHFYRYDIELIANFGIHRYFEMRPGTLGIERVFLLNGTQSQLLRKTSHMNVPKMLTSFLKKQVNIMNLTNNASPNYKICT